MHDFLLAAMIVYLSLSHGTRSSDDQQERVNALAQSRALWNQEWTVSAESKKAAMVLGIMLKKVQSGTGVGLSSTGAPTSTSSAAQGRRVDGVSSLSLNGMKVLILSFPN
jgi:hypothetical protein